MTELLALLAWVVGLPALILIARWLWRLGAAAERWESITWEDDNNER